MRALFVFAVMAALAVVCARASMEEMEQQTEVRMHLASTEMGRRVLTKVDQELDREAMAMLMRQDPTPVSKKGGGSASAPEGFADKVVKHVEALEKTLKTEVQALHDDWAKERLACEASLVDTDKEIKTLSDELMKAETSVTDNSAEVASLKAQIDALRQDSFALTTRARDSQKQLNEGKAARDRQHQIFVHAKDDCDEVIEAIDTLVAQLSSNKKTDEAHAKKIQLPAATSTKDSTLARFLESAQDAVAATNPEDVEALAKLLDELKNQIVSYRRSLTEEETRAQVAWEALAKGILNDYNLLVKQRDTNRARVADHKKKIEDLQSAMFKASDMKEVLPPQLSYEEKERESWTEECKLKRANFVKELGEKQDAYRTILAMKALFEKTLHADHIIESVEEAHAAHQAKEEEAAH